MNFDLLGKDVIYSGRVFDLVHAHFRLPDGREHTYDLVNHHGAVTILPVDESGNIWFVRQFRIGAMQWLLELPAGLLEAGETPEASAQREIQEEIGMLAENLVKLGEFYMVPGYSTEKLHAYLATGLRDSALPPDDDEFLERQSIPVRQVYDMAERNEIQDGKTLASLLIARPYLLKFL
jgi:nudix-type nucleoside diphosphatase (YffH/AdpP family)